jgi:hypothetical protein
MKAADLLRVILVAISLSGCGDTEIKNERDHFVPGDLIIGIHADVPIDSVFNLINKKGLVIDQMSGFFNYSTFPNDSLEYVKKALRDKPYLNKRGFKGGAAFLHAIDNRIIVTEFLFEMDTTSQQDWLETINRLQLVDLGNDTRCVSLKVKPGQEKAWLAVFNDHPYVKWVELNWYAHIVLF